VECGDPIEGKRRGARFCSNTCRNNSAGKAFRGRRKTKDPGSGSLEDGELRHLLNGQGKTADSATLPRRRISDAAAVVRPGELQRPFDTFIGDEDPEVTAELRPQPLACETQRFRRYRRP
jgi:hypothetical protein